MFLTPLSDTDGRAVGETPNGGAARRDVCVATVFETRGSRYVVLLQAALVGRHFLPVIHAAGAEAADNAK